jgi:hypothetical protein
MHEKKKWDPLIFIKKKKKKKKKNKNVCCAWGGVGVDACGHKYTVLLFFYTTKHIIDHLGVQHTMYKFVETLLLLLEIFARNIFVCVKNGTGILLVR